MHFASPVAEGASAADPVVFHVRERDGVQSVRLELQPRDAAITRDVDSRPIAMWGQLAPTGRLAVAVPPRNHDETATLR